MSSSSNLTPEKFRPFTEVEASHQWPGFHKPNLTVSKIMQDCQPFQHEVQAYERIDRYCPNYHRSYFPRYFGVVDLIPPSYSLPLQGVVMSPLTVEPTLDSLRTSHVPPHLNRFMAKFQAELNLSGLSRVEAKWYHQVLLGRAIRLTVLHSLCITHGDVKDEIFRIPLHPHDVALHDFSTAYTFTPERPCMMNYFPRHMTLKRASDVDLFNVLRAAREQ